MNTLRHTERAGVDMPVAMSSVARARTMTMAHKESLVAYLSLIPAFLLLTVFMWYPLATAFYHSFTLWDGENSVWVGLQNYGSIVSSGQLWLLLRNNVIFLFSIPGILLLSLVVAVLLFEKVAGWRIFRSIYYLPCILSVVVVGYLMKTFFSAQGTVNAFFKVIGLGGLEIAWLDRVPTAFAVLIIAFYWQTLGSGMLIFLSGLSSISTDLLDAARIDGAGWWQRLYKVIVPLLSPAISYFLVTTSVYVFIGLFGLVYSITRGGPGYETMPIDYMIYVKAFEGGDLSYASALSVILLILVSALSWFQIKTLDRLASD